MDVKNGVKSANAIARRKYHIIGTAAGLKHAKLFRTRDGYNRVHQDDTDDEEWAHDAAKVYLRAWIISWHQLHEEDYKGRSLFGAMKT